MEQMPILEFNGAYLKILPSGPLSTNAYVIVCAKTGNAAIIDPAPQSFVAIKEFITNYDLKADKILLTHTHWDHIAEVGKLKEFYTIPIYVHALDAPNLQQPGVDGLPVWLEIPPVQPDVLLAEGMQVGVGELKFDVIHTPGHSPGGVCFYEADRHLLFSGDTLFQGTMGKISLPTGEPAKMWPSLARLAKLPRKPGFFLVMGRKRQLGKKPFGSTMQKSYFQISINDLL